MWQFMHLELFIKIEGKTKKILILYIPSSQEIREYIESLKANAKQSGKNSLVLTARDVHGSLKLKSRYPMVCNAMRHCMEENDAILFQPPKGNSSTLEIEYKF